MRRLSLYTEPENQYSGCEERNDLYTNTKRKNRNKGSAWKGEGFKLSSVVGSQRSFLTRSRVKRSSITSLYVQLVVQSPARMPFQVSIHFLRDKRCDV